MSYGTNKQTVGALSGPGMRTPPHAELSPLNAYMTLFANFAGGAIRQTDNGLAAAPPTADAMLTNLASRRSVLDFAKTRSTSSVRGAR